MAIPAAVAIVPLGVFFILSGLIVNLIQAVMFIFIRPVTKSLHRRINKVIAELLWLELIWLVDWWAGVQVELYTDEGTFQLLGKENSLVISNHRGDIDWLVGWVLAQRSGCLGNALAITRKELKFLPILGWSMWFSDYIFLERSWAKDEETLKSGFKRLEDFPLPFWLALFVEGTRFTQANLLVAQEYAASEGLPIPRNVLVPHTKGFVSAVLHMRPFVPAIYDCTLVVPKDQPSPTLRRMFSGQPFTVHLRLRRHLMKELPETSDGIAEWCRDAFVAKDAMLQKHFAENAFGDLEHQDIGCPKKSLFVMLSWSFIIVSGILGLFIQFPFLASWKCIAVSVTFLVLVAAVMEILIRTSESERSTPIYQLISDPVKQRLLDNMNHEEINA